MDWDIDPYDFSAENMERAGRMLSCEVERRQFLRKAGRWAGGIALTASLGALASCGRDIAVRRTTAPVPSAPAAKPPTTATADLAIASGPNTADITRKAVDALGGMGRFVKRGNVVLVKVNASFLNGPRAATTTDPAVAGQVVAMCKEAGASKVIVLDHILCGSAEQGFGTSGIGDAVEKNGGVVLGFGAGDNGNGVDAEVPQGKVLRRTNVYPEVLNADVVITVPKAKHHGGSGLTLGMKNLIGVTTRMSEMHNGLHQSVADLTTLVKPALSIIDASVILLKNGPGGPGPTRAAGQVIASPDVVAADSYACTLFGLTAANVPYVLNGERAGLGTSNFNSLKVARV